MGGDPRGAPRPPTALQARGCGEGGKSSSPVGLEWGGTARIQLDHVGVHPPLARAGGRHGGRGRPRGSGRAVSAAAAGRGRPAPRGAGKRRAARCWDSPLSLSPPLSPPLSPTGAPPRAARAPSAAPAASAPASLWTPDVTRGDVTAPRRFHWPRPQRSAGPEARREL